MAEKKVLTSEELYRVIVSLVAESFDSPYERMMRKAKDIDLDYFDPISHSGNELPSELNMELKDQIVNDFGKMADHYFIEGQLAENLLAFVREQAAQTIDENGCSTQIAYLEDVATKLQSYAERMKLLDWPKFTAEGLKEKYEYAKEITLREFLFGNNYKDVLEFYSALMDKTWWECQELILKRTQDFLIQLASKIREEVR